MRATSLDIDGVLQPSPRHLPRAEVSAFGWLPLLERLLEAHPDVGLVIHSSWRETYTPDELQDMLHPMEHRFVGVTPPGERSTSIAAWRSANPPFDRMLVLDDDPDLTVPTGVALARCDPRRGLDDAEVRAAIAAWLDVRKAPGAP